MRESRLFFAAIGALLGAFVSVALTCCSWPIAAPRDVSIAGCEWLPRESEAAWVARCARRFAQQPAYLSDAEELREFSFRELGLELDVLATRGALPEPPPREPWQWVRRAWSGPPRELLEVTPVLRFDGERAAQLLAALSASLARAPRDAALDVAHHRRVEERAGRELELERTLAHIEAGARAHSAVFPLAFRVLPARIVSASLPAVDVSQVLSSYETSFRGHAGARAVNIRRAAALLDGTLLAPSERFSFNRRVGPRVAERGFVEAPVLVRDETESGPGGGVCQVATTLHAAALLGGLRVVERRSHSRPSGYAPLGLDATVIDGKVDLRFENNLASQLLIHAYLPTKTSVRVELLGHAPLGRVEHFARVMERHPYLRRILRSESLASGSFEQKQKGGFGYDVTSLVRLTAFDGSVSTHQYRSKYYPVPEVLLVGPGTPLGALPPLPEGAAGLEAPPEPAEP